jgi:hypothetical protein
MWCKAFGLGERVVVAIELETWKLLFGFERAGQGNWLFYVGPLCIVLQWSERP